MNFESVGSAMKSSNETWDQTAQILDDNSQHMETGCQDMEARGSATQMMSGVFSYMADSNRDPFDEPTKLFTTEQDNSPASPQHDQQKDMISSLYEVSNDLPSSEGCDHPSSMEDILTTTSHYTDTITDPRLGGSLDPCCTDMELNNLNMLLSRATGGMAQHVQQAHDIAQAHNLIPTNSSDHLPAIDVFTGAVVDTNPSTVVEMTSPSSIQVLASGYRNSIDEADEDQDNSTTSQKSQEIDIKTIQAYSEHTILKNVKNRKHLRRIKNNEASKVTRARRKSAVRDLVEREEELMIQNAELKVKVQILQKHAEIFRDLLIQSMSKRFSDTKGGSISVDSSKDSSKESHTDFHAEVLNLLQPSH